MNTTSNILLKHSLQAGLAAELLKSLPRPALSGAAISFLEWHTTRPTYETAILLALIEGRLSAHIAEDAESPMAPEMLRSEFMRLHAEMTKLRRKFGIAAPRRCNPRRATKSKQKGARS